MGTRVDHSSATQRETGEKRDCFCPDYAMGTFPKFLMGFSSGGPCEKNAAPSIPRTFVQERARN